MLHRRLDGAAGICDQSADVELWSHPRHRGDISAFAELLRVL